jgi:hypothetical protein
VGGEQRRNKRKYKGKILKRNESSHFKKCQKKRCALVPTFINLKKLRPAAPILKKVPIFACAYSFNYFVFVTKYNFPAARDCGRCEGRSFKTRSFMLHLFLKHFREMQILLDTSDVVSAIGVRLNEPCTGYLV